MSTSGPIRILLVEDQYFVRVALHALLEDRTDMAIVAETDLGSEALRLFEEHRPDVVVMDLRLPGLSGFEAIRHIRASHQDARIVVLSNYEGSEDVHRALDAGACAYLTKDASPDELVAAILTARPGQTYLPRALHQLLEQRISADELTPRELEVLEQLAKGLSNKEIAFHLGIAEKTVRIHMSRILDKLGVSDRTGAVIQAVQRGLVHLK
jgi:DNA-binding NarL/FixJ family response regulator